MADCTCDVAAPRHECSHGREMIGKYAVRLDQWDDDTRFDPACPFHGDNGTMVVRLAAQLDEPFVDYAQTARRAVRAAAEHGASCKDILGVDPYRQDGYVG